MSNSDLKRDDSAHSRVINMVMSQIKTEKLRPGDQLLPIRELSKVAGVGVFSAQRAIAELRRRGVVEACRGRGTFVSKKFNGFRKDSPGSEAGSVLQNLAICSAFANVSEGFQIKHPGTVAGILGGCDDEGIKAQLITPLRKLSTADEILAELSEGSYNGVVWLYPSDREVALLEAVDEAGVPVVITSHRSLATSLACVQDDNSLASVQLARHIAERGCGRILRLEISYMAGHHPALDDAGLVQGGLARTEELPGGAPEQQGMVDVVNLNFGEPDVANILRTKLAESSEKTAVLMPGADCCSDFLRYRSEEARELLAGCELVVTTTEGGVELLRPLSAELDFYISIHPFETMGQLAVRKLQNIAQGAFKETITLVPVKFKRMRNGEV